MRRDSSVRNSFSSGSWNDRGGTRKSDFGPMTMKPLKKLLAYIGAFYGLQMIAGLIGGVVYAFYTTPLDLAPWLQLFRRLL
jgi:hypothetical protein